MSFVNGLGMMGPGFYESNKQLILLFVIQLNCICPMIDKKITIRIDSRFAKDKKSFQT